LLNKKHILNPETIHSIENLKPVHKKSNEEIENQLNLIGEVFDSDDEI